MRLRHERGTTFRILQNADPLSTQRRCFYRRKSAIDGPEPLGSAGKKAHHSGGCNSKQHLDPEVFVGRLTEHLDFVRSHDGAVPDCMSNDIDERVLAWWGIKQAHLMKAYANPTKRAKMNEDNLLRIKLLQDHGFDHVLVLEMELESLAKAIPTVEGAIAETIPVGKGAIRSAKNKPASLRRLSEWNSKWEKMLSGFIVFCKEKGKLPYIRSGDAYEQELAAWRYHQRRLHKEGKLRPDRLEKLMKAGNVLDAA